MKVSLNLAQRFSNVDLQTISRDELLRKVGAQLGAVEETIDFGARFDGALVVRVASCQDHPDADRLHVCRIDDGGRTEGVERGDDGLVQVVCGAPNVREGLTVVWLPPGATVPSSRDETEPFVLEARALRGVVSQGMLASAQELGLGDDHAGILEIDEPVEPGTPFKQLFDLDDFVIDCENKMFTHRPDCFGVLGVARELAGIQGLAFESPQWYRDVPHFENSDRLPLAISNETGQVSRFMAVALDNVSVKPSPTWLQSALVRVGLKPINNVVDITNYVMHLTAQPLHAYDYDKVAARSADSRLVSRQANDGETLTVLGGKTIQLDEADIVIATDAQPVALAGVTGGADTEVDASTTRVILEVATFDMYAVRRSSMRHGLFTEAVTRFNKGQSPLQNDRVLAYAMRLLTELTGAYQASDVSDAHDRLETMPDITITVPFINERLGSHLSAAEIRQLLENVEIPVGGEGDALIVSVPFWRRDLELPEDIVEEVGRLYGLDKLPVVLPKRSSAPARRNNLVALKRDVRTVLAAGGSNEVLSYNFVHGDLLEKVGQHRDDAFRLRNALSPQLQYYRLSLTPNLLNFVHPNIKAGHDGFVLYELGTAHSRRDIDAAGLPIEHHRLAVVCASRGGQGSAFYQARAYLDYLAEQLGVIVKYQPLLTAKGDPLTQPYEPVRSARVETESGGYLGVVGEFRASVQTALKLPDYVAGFEIDLDALIAGQRVARTYRPLSKYPGTSQDICFRVAETVRFFDVQQAIKHALSEIAIDTAVEPVDIYQAEGTSDRQFTFRIKMTDREKTIANDTAHEIVQKIIKTVSDQTGATVV